ncbi:MULTISPECIES: hypothetical protein [unclassified Agromyces]|uniref:hypothetical protein n=1 Tax=unclassified Agromyces TaxID=2639701 RepID=UPI0030148E92
MNLDLSPLSKHGAIFNVVISGSITLFGLGLVISSAPWGWGLFLAGLGVLALFIVILLWVLRRER